MVEIGILAAAGYAAVVGALYLLQDGMLFPHARTPPPERVPPPAMERWTVTGADGAELHGVFLPAAGGGTPIVLGFPGNAWNAQDFAVFLHERLPGADVVAFHYRGYAPSEGSPSERALVADALALTDRVRRRWPDRPIVPVGVSLGSGVAAAVVAEREVAGAVLVTPFDSIRALARARYWWAPVGLLLRHPFDSAARLADVDRPIAVISAARDTLIPPARTGALVDRLDHLVDHHVFAEHDHMSLYDDPRFGEVLARQVEAVVRAQLRRSSGT